MKYKMKDGVTYKEFLKAVNQLDEPTLKNDYYIMTEKGWFKPCRDYCDMDFMTHDTVGTCYSYMYKDGAVGDNYWDISSIIEEYVEPETMEERVEKIDNHYIGDHFDGEAKPPVELTGYGTNDGTNDKPYASHYLDGIPCNEIQDEVVKLLADTCMVPPELLPLVWNVIKYVRRCGKKEGIEPKDDIYKIADYMHKIVTGEFHNIVKARGDK